MKTSMCDTGLLLIDPEDVVVLGAAIERAAKFGALAHTDECGARHAPGDTEVARIRTEPRFPLRPRWIVVGWDRWAESVTIQVEEESDE